MAKTLKDIRDVKLGQKAKDLVTGYEGTITGVEVHVGRCAQVAIQPPVTKDGKIPDAHMIDIPRIKITDEKQTIKTEIPDELPYEFGQEMEDKYSGYRGKVVGISFHINGCTVLALQPKHDAKKEKFGHGIWFAETQLKVIGKRLTPTPVKELPKTGSIHGSLVEESTSSSFGGAR